MPYFGVMKLVTKENGYVKSRINLNKILILEGNGMEIKVNEQAQRFYLAFDEWVPAVGHEIKVGKYRFCAIQLSDSINISEVTSGIHAISIPIDSRILMATSTKEDTMRVLAKAGEGLRRILERQSNLDESLAKRKR